MELHEWLLFFHILGSIIWVGGVIVQNAVMARASRAPDRTAVLRLSAELEWIGPWLIGPSSLVVIGLGIWLVLLEEWAAFSQSWIWLSLVLVAVSTIQGIYSGVEGKWISRLADGRGAEDGEVRDRLSRLLLLARLDITDPGVRPPAHGVQARRLTASGYIPNEGVVLPRRRFAVRRRHADRVEFMG